MEREVQHLVHRGQSVHLAACWMSHLVLSRDWRHVADAHLPFVDLARRASIGSQGVPDESVRRCWWAEAAGSLTAEA